jgi:DNA-binding transcriptional LysR family regulator
MTRPVTFPTRFVKFFYMIDPALLPALHDALVVAQTSSIGEAARRLHKTPSAVSQQLRRIEDHFGVHLFEKIGRRIRPSQAGEAALGALTRVFDEAASLGTLLSELAGARVTTLRIAASDYLGEALLLPVMRELVEAKVPLHFEIATTNSTEASRMVLESLADAAIVSADRETTPDERVLFRQPFVWVAPRLRRGSAPARGGVRGRLEREPLLRLLPGSRGRRLLDEYLGRTGVRPVSSIDMPSVSLMLSYAVRGLGIGLAPALAVAELDRRKVVVEPADVPELDVRLLVRPGLAKGAAVTRFLDRLTEEAHRAGARLA